ncbi:MAG: hypothetical protein Q8S53_06280 [Brevundimonas sp.]|uniref:hypothetical protein n=1 Tax=Brevundimonas sp. TaxID=1871086 RepID=UPI0027358EEA|nr:hypothetical protein [Brevundimonas sp.]MDP3377955.1 hypothetical protein [Brevundimonas sp.]
MAEPGDPDLFKDQPAPRPEADPDAEVGFCSPDALAGHPRTVEPEPEPGPEMAAGPEPDPQPASEPRLIEDPLTAPLVAPLAAPAYTPPPRRERADDLPEPEGMMGLYTVYALILFAIPTFGVSAVIGLLAVMVRDVPTHAVAASHHVFQVRTLWTAAVVTVLGIILIVVNVGVFVLFLLVLWVLMRGAWGSWLLKSRRAIPNPRSWWI